MQAKTLLGATLVALFVGNANAHEGPRVYLDVVNGRIVTKTGPESGVVPNPASLPEARKFQIRAGVDEQIGDNLFLNAFPGFTTVTNSEFHQNDMLKIRFLDSVRVWSGSGFVVPVADWHFAYVSPTTGLDVDINVNGPTAYNDFWKMNNSGSSLPHNHPQNYLFGDGEDFVPGSDGIYMLNAQIAATAAPGFNTVYQASAPFKIFFRVDMFGAGDVQPAPFPHSLEDFTKAFNARVQLLPPLIAPIGNPMFISGPSVPEPGCAGLIVLSFFGIGVRFRNL